MSGFWDSFFGFGSDYVSVALISMFVENVIFTRAIGASTSLLIIRKKYSMLTFGAVIALITTLASVIVYFVDPLIAPLSYVAYIRPLVYILIISIIYVLLVIIVSNSKRLSNAVLPLIHLSAFNCAVLGALLLGNQSHMRFSQFLGFGMGTGIGFVLATYLLSLGYKRLNSDSVPPAFRGLPATMIYTGILSLAFYGIIGSELPF